MFPPFLLSDTPFTPRLYRWTLAGSETTALRRSMRDVYGKWQAGFHGNHFTLWDDEPFSFKDPVVLLNMIHARCLFISD